MVDIFFWMSAFLASYLLLVKMKESRVSFWVVIMNRLVRLWPSYAITLLFGWKIMTLFGGEGPTFFMYG
jgi:peptidoglycan/LPS O-acetylase OafA/YrhL